jgi:hypothetical protein
MSDIETTIKQFIQACNDTGWTVLQNQEDVEEGIRGLEDQFKITLSEEIKACYRCFSEDDYIESFDGYRIISIEERKQSMHVDIDEELRISFEMNRITEEQYQTELKNNYFYWPIFVSEFGDEIVIHLRDSTIYHNTHDDGYGTDIRGLVKHYSSLKNMLETLTLCVQCDLLMDENGDWSKEKKERYVFLHREREPDTPYWFEDFHLNYR